MAGIEDRISEFPDEILHQILSFLPMKVAAQTAVLSRRWKHIWDSYPVFDFCQNSLFRVDPHLHPHPHPHELDDGICEQERSQYWETVEKLTNSVGQKFEKFCEYMGWELEKSCSRHWEILMKLTSILDHKLEKFCEYKIGIQKFKLSIVLEDQLFDWFVDRWMEVVSEKHVKELDLFIKVLRDECFYVLPQTIFAAKSLTILKIRGDNLILEDPFMESAVDLHSLRTLSLEKVHVDKKTIQNLISSCPSVEDLCLSFDENTLESLNVSGLVKLVNLKVNMWTDRYLPMKLSGCERLRRVSLFCVSLDCVFNDVNFPQVEFISLSSSRFKKGFKICSHQLKTLVIEDCFQDRKLDIFAPNLISVRHAYNCLPRYRFLPYLNANCTLKVQLRALGGLSVSTPWYIGLKEYLQEQKQTKTLEVCFNLVEAEFDREEAEKSNCLWPPHALECLALDMRSPLDYAAIMDGLFWCSHPQVLSIRSYPRCFIKFLFKMLKDRKEEGCCSSGEIKCWRHSLKKVSDSVIVEHKGIEENVPLCWNTFKRTVPEFWRKRVHFYLTW